MIKLRCGEIMKNIFTNLLNFLSSLTIIDLIFFLFVFVLLILIVVLIYIIRLNSEEDIEIVSDDNIVKSSTDEPDLALISEAIEAGAPKPIILNDYEKEQEEKAIISYDELIKAQKKDNEVINYQEETDYSGLKVKAIDVSNLTKEIELPKMKEEKSANIAEEAPELKNKSSILISYEKEEAFLQLLKKMQQLLN